jgi:hypothetical protein
VNVGYQGRDHSAMSSSVKNSSFGIWYFSHVSASDAASHSRSREAACIADWSKSGTLLAGTGIGGGIAVVVAVGAVKRRSLRAIRCTDIVCFLKFVYGRLNFCKIIA